MNLKRNMRPLKRSSETWAGWSVAYSGGVDSSYLLKAAVDTLGPQNVLALHQSGPVRAANMYEKASQRPLCRSGPS